MISLGWGVVITFILGLAMGIGSLTANTMRNAILLGCSSNLLILVSVIMAIGWLFT